MLLGFLRATHIRNTFGRSTSIMSPTFLERVEADLVLNPPRLQPKPARPTSRAVTTIASTHTSKAVYNHYIGLSSNTNTSTNKRQALGEINTNRKGWPNSKPAQKTRTVHTSIPFTNPYTTTGGYSWRDAKPMPARVYTRNVEETDELLACLSGPLGFDIEWKVVKTAGPQRKTALIQICDKRMILLIQVSAMKEFPPKLKEIIESPTIPKMGICIIGDMRKLNRDFGIEAQGILDLVEVGKKYDPEFHIRGRCKTLHNFVAKYLQKDLDKGPVRISDWEQELTEVQMEYAASDAYCGLEVYQRIREIGRACGRDDDISCLLRSFIKPVPTGQRLPDPPLHELANESTPISDLWATSLRRTVPTPQQQKAYDLWHIGEKSLDDICCELRSPENPLKKSTVITYVVEAIKADSSLPFNMDSLKELLMRDHYSFQRHKRWYYYEQGEGGREAKTSSI